MVTSLCGPKLAPKLCVSAVWGTPVLFGLTKIIPGHSSSDLAAGTAVRHDHTWALTMLILLLRTTGTGAEKGSLSWMYLGFPVSTVSCVGSLSSPDLLCEQLRPSSFVLIYPTVPTALTGADACAWTWTSLILTWLIDWTWTFLITLNLFGGHWALGWLGWPSLTCSVHLIWGLWDRAWWGLQANKCGIPNLKRENYSLILTGASNCKVVIGTLQAVPIFVLQV